MTERHLPKRVYEHLAKATPFQTFGIMARMAEVLDLGGGDLVDPIRGVGIGSHYERSSTRILQLKELGNIRATGRPILSLAVEADELQVVARTTGVRMVGERHLTLGLSNTPFPVLHQSRSKPGSWAILGWWRTMVGRRSV